MALPVPTLDTRGYRELLAEAIARIPVHNPEWTNFNESDPGVTLLQLFAFMGDNLVFRANLIPERNRLKFLSLLGIPLRPASAAEGVVTIVNDRGPREAPTLEPGLTVTAGSLRFVTGNALDVLPVEAQLYVRRQLTPAEEADAGRIYEQLYGPLQEPASQMAFYQTTRVTPSPGAATPRPVDLRADVVDGSLWLALLLRPGDEGDQVKASIAGKTLTLGVMPWLAEETRIIRPGGAMPVEPLPPLAFDLSSRDRDAGAPRYTSLDARADANPFENLTIVQLTLPAANQIATWIDLDPLEEGVGEFPPALEDEDIRARLLAWLRVRIAPDPSGGATTGAWNARFSWIGINAARVVQRTEVVAEFIGTGNGEPDQTFKVVNTPVIADSVRVGVGGEQWHRVEDLYSAPPEVGGRIEDAKVFAVDRESGQIRFGDGLHGVRPPTGSVLVASYAFGGGRAGNVGAGAINASPQLPAGFTVANPLPTWGGDDGQRPEDAERDIPRQFRECDRAVSADDFHGIVKRTPGVAVGRVDVLPLFDQETDTTAPGVVTLLLVPDDLTRGDTPSPDRLFLQAVCRHLEPRRLLTTEVQLSGPDYVPVSIAIGFDAVAGRDVATVREGVQAEIRRFLSPLKGGYEGAGWPLESAVDSRELWARAASVPGVAVIRGVRLWNADGAEVQRIELTGLELPRIARLSVRFGEPEDVPAGPPPPPVKRVPVPVLPPSC